MDKNAHYQLVGQDLGYRFAVDHLINSMDKTASDEEKQIVQDAAIGLDYQDQVVKQAYNLGTLNAFAAVVEQFEKGASVKDVIKQLNDTIDSKTASVLGPAPESEDELQGFYDEMVKGAATSIAAVLGEDVESDEILKAAQTLVDEHIAQFN